MPMVDGVGLPGIKVFLLADGPSSSSSLSICLFLLDSPALNEKGLGLSVEGMLNEKGLLVAVASVVGLPNEKDGAGLSPEAGVLKENVEEVAGFSEVEGVPKEKLGVAGLSVAAEGVLNENEPEVFPNDPKVEVVDLSDSDEGGLLKVKAEEEDLLDPTDEILARFSISFSTTSPFSTLSSELSVTDFPNDPKIGAVDEGTNGLALADNVVSVVFSTVGLTEPNVPNGEGFSVVLCGANSSELFPESPSELSSVVLSFSVDSSAGFNARDGFAAETAKGDGFSTEVLTEEGLSEEVPNGEGLSVGLPKGEGLSVGVPKAEGLSLVDFSGGLGILNGAALEVVSSLFSASSLSEVLVGAAPVEGLPNENPVLLAGVPNPAKSDGVSLVFLGSVDLSSVDVGLVPKPAKRGVDEAVDGFPKPVNGEGVSTVFVEVFTVEAGVPNEKAGAGLVDASVFALSICPPNPPKEGLSDFSGSVGFVAAGVPNENPEKTDFFGSALLVEGVPKENAAGALIGS